MAHQQMIDDLKPKSEVCYGDELCKQKSKFLLQEVGLPLGLLPLDDIIESGYVEETGFVWLKQKKKIEHRFEKIGKVVSYAPEITAYVEKFKIKKLTGVKSKELLLWVNLNEISVDDPKSGKLTFKIHGGLYRTFPFSAFEIDEEKKEEEKVVGGLKDKKEEGKAAAV